MDIRHVGCSNVWRCSLLDGTMTEGLGQYTARVPGMVTKRLRTKATSNHGRRAAPIESKCFGSSSKPGEWSEECGNLPFEHWYVLTLFAPPLREHG